MKKRRTLVLFVIFSLFACNVDGANGIFYAITQEVEAEQSNLDIRLTPKDMIETEDFLFLVANGLHASFKDGRVVNDLVWIPLNTFENVSVNGESQPFLQTESSSANCKDAIVVENGGNETVIASLSIDDDYNAYQSPNNPEYNRNFRVNRIFQLVQSDASDPGKWSWKEIPIEYPAMKHTYTDAFRQMEVERIFNVDGEIYFLFNEKFIRKKYYITDENGNEVANTEQAVKSPYFTLCRVDGLFSGSPTFTEISMPSEKDRVSMILDLFAFKRNNNTEIWFATGKNLYAINGNSAETVDIYVSTDIGNSGYYLNSRIETITAVYCASPSPYLTEDQKFFSYEGNRYRINQDDTVFLSVTFTNHEYDKINRLFRYTKTVSQSIGSGSSSLTFDWNWSECLIEGQDSDDLIVYAISEYYANYTIDGKETLINKLVIGTNDGYLEAAPANVVPQFITVNYDDAESTSASNLSTLILETASVIGFYCADKGTSEGRLFAFTAGNGIWENVHKVWSRE